MSIIPIRSEASTRGARMLRTALGPEIAAWLEDVAVIEVMLNPDGRLWIDRLGAGIADTGREMSAPMVSGSSGWSRTMSGPRFMPKRRASRLSCPTRVSGLSGARRAGSDERLCRKKDHAAEFKMTNHVDQ